MAVVCLNEILSLSQPDYSEYKRKSQTLAKVLSKANGNDIMISIIKLITLSTLKKSIKWFLKKPNREWQFLPATLHDQIAKMYTLISKKKNANLYNQIFKKKICYDIMRVVVSKFTNR